MRTLKKWFWLMLLCGAGPGCFSRFVMTEKEVKAWYQQKPVKPTFFTIQNDSVTLFCATTGIDTLPPLLMIHGAPGAWYGSRNLLDDSILQKHYHIIAIDRPGYNKSRFKGKRKLVPGIDIQATAIYEAMRLNRSNKKGVVMGSSYGSAIAAKIAIDHPDRFRQLIMLAPAIDPDREKFWWFHPYINGGPVSWFLPRFINNATREKFAHVQELRLMLPHWKSLLVPVVAIQGGADEIIDPGNLDFARTLLKDKEATFIFLPKAGHLLRWQHAQKVRELLLRP